MSPIKLIVGPDAGGVGYYAHERIGWAFCTGPNDKNESTVITPMGYCREILTNSMYIHMSPESNEGDDRYEGIDISRLRLIARIVLNNKHDAVDREKLIERFFDRLSVGVKMLNILEERNSWVLTTLHDTIHGIHPDLITKMVVGSSRWLKSAHMLSLFCLLIRVATDTSVEFTDKNVTDFKSLDKAMKDYGIEPTDTYGLSDKKYIYAVWPYVDTIMKNYRVLFKGTLIKSNWVIGKNDRYYTEGIHKLCSGGSADEKLSGRFSGLKEKITGDKE